MGLNANVLKMDKFGNVDDFTFVLSTKKYKHLGQLNNVNTETVDFKANLNGANELSFEVYKKVEDEVEKLWNDIIDLKSLYVPELNEYFEIQVTYDDKLDEIKTIVAKSLCESELSQIYIYGTEINTETDINRTDYVQTTFYNRENPKASLLHRVLSFVPQYTIKHVDASLCNLQRSFSIDNTTVYDFLIGECSEQFNCLFIFDSTDRSISVYDLYTTCNDCGHRDAYNFVCPECGSTNVSYFGEDTDIFVNKENLSDDIKLETDVGSIKNCLRLRSGDDIMDEAIISMNPNGTRYIYYISDEQREDMSDELVNKIDEYDELVEQYTPEYQYLSLNIRELTDRKTYYESTMMLEAIGDNEEVPSDSISNTEITKLIQNKLSPIGMEEMTPATSLETADIVVKNYARVFVNTSLVKIDIVEGSTFEYKGKDGNWDYGIWKGKIKLTAWSDPNDIAISDTFTLTIHDNYGDFLQQKVMKEMALNDKEGSVFNVLALENINEFKEALTKYCLSRLNSFRLSLDTACTTLVSLDQATVEADWYQRLYIPYHNKLLACADEITVREAQIKEVQNQLDVLYARKSEIQSILNFENYLGEELYLEFCTYKREGEYHNEYYISDGLPNAEIIDKAREFIEVAKKEMIRAATRRHTISTGLYNLMLMEEFKPLVNKFALGNFIRLKVGEELFRLRLNSYHLTFSDLTKLDVEFTDMTKSVDVVTATQKILSDAQSMASNFSYVSKQAEKGKNADESVKDIVQEGLNSALVQIKNNVNEETIIDNNGYLGRSYDDIIGKYSPEQVRLTHNIFCFTEDDWETTSLALGKHKYTYYDLGSKTFKQSVGFGLSSKFVQAGYVYGSQIIGGDIYSENYSDTKGSYLGLNDGSFNFGHKIVYDSATDKMTMQGVTIKWDTTTPPEISDISGLENHLNQLDGRIQTYSQATDPSTSWTATEKSNNIGDLWFDTQNSLTKRWNGSTWDIVTDSELETLAKSKAQIFTATPTTPYYVGDLWVQGETGDIMNCVKTRTSGNYTASDWKKSSKYTDDSALETFITGDYADDLEMISKQIDKRAQTWYLTKTEMDAEVATWTDKTIHVGDLWYRTDVQSGQDQTFVYNSSYKWEVINGVPKEVFDMADGKCSLYTSKPSNYKAKDIWILDVDNVSGSNTTYPKYEKGTLLVSSKNNTSYSKDDWKELVKYSSKLQEFIDGEYADDLEDIGTQIDGKARSWYQSTDPSLTWDKNEDHEGDLWYNTSVNSQVTSIYDNGAWRATSVPKELFDTIDGIASIYVTIPDKPQIGDLLIPTSNIGSYKAGKVYKYNGTTWVEIAYTDDTKANEAYTLADSAKGIAENAKTIGNNLVTGLGFKKTEIGDSYIISPAIAGGTLLIGDTTGTYAQITTEGKLICTGAQVSGDIVANSLTLGTNVKVSTNNINGLSTVATSGKYDDLTGKPTIPTSVADLGLDTSKIIYKGDITQTTKTDSNGINYLETKVPSSNGGTITYSTYEADNYLVFGRSKGTNSSGKDYVCISKEGVLTARNAFIYGTIYATDGEFTGKITSSSGKIGGITISTDRLYSRNAMTQGIAGTQYEASIRMYNPDVASPTTEPAFLLRKRNYDGTNYDSSWQHMFKVTYEGKLTALNAVITGDITATSGKITGNLEIGGSLTHNSGNYTVTLRGVQSNVANGVFFITDKSSGSDTYPFRINGDGSFSATKANITGGKIAGIEIDSSGLYYSGSSSTDGFGLWKNGHHKVNDKYVIMHAGANGSHISEAKFKLYQDGSVDCSNLKVTGGSITLGDATLNSSGLTVGSPTGTSTIGSFKIDDNSIFRGTWSDSANSAPDVFMCSGSKGTYTIGGLTDSGWVFGAKNKFGVTKEGALYCTSGEIGGIVISEDGLGSTTANSIKIFPQGKEYYTYHCYVVIFENGTPKGGLASDGWHNFY